MDPILFNAEHAALQPANDDSHEAWARDYSDAIRREVAAFITDDVWRRGGLI